MLVAAAVKLCYYIPTEVVSSNVIRYMYGCLNQMLESASRGRLSIHHADIMKFYIPDAFPEADMEKWESNGT